MNFDYVNLLTDTWKTVWKNKSIWILVLIPMLVSFLPIIMVFIPIFGLAGFDPNPNTLNVDAMSSIFFLAFIAVFILSALLNLFASSASNASVSLGVIRAERGEGSTNFMILLREGFPYFWRMMGVILIIGLAIGLVFGLISLLSAVLIAVTIGMASFCVQPLYLLITPLMFVMMGAQEAAQIAVIKKDLSVVDAIKHALEVVREHVWKYVIIALVIYFASMILSFVIIFPLMVPMFAAFPLVEGAGLNDSQAAVMISGFMICLFFPAMMLMSSFVRALLKVSPGLAYLRLTPPAQETENQVIFSEA